MIVEASILDGIGEMSEPKAITRKERMTKQFAQIPTERLKVQ